MMFTCPVPDLENHPEVVCLNNDKQAPSRISIWHSDVTWRKEASLDSILRAPTRDPSPRYYCSANQGTFGTLENTR
jgi:hypothetical protein